MGSDTPSRADHRQPAIHRDAPAELCSAVQIQRRRDRVEQRIRLLSERRCGEQDREEVAEGRIHAASAAEMVGWSSDFKLQDDGPHRRESARVRLNCPIATAGGTRYFLAAACAK